jgi:hypothetical protein
MVLEDAPRPTSEHDLAVVALDLLVQLPPDTGARPCGDALALFHTTGFGVLNPPDDDMPAISGANCTVQLMTQTGGS